MWFKYYCLHICMSVSTNLARNIVDVNVIYVHYRLIFISKRTKKNPGCEKNGLTFLV